MTRMNKVADTHKDSVDSAPEYMVYRPFGPNIIHTKMSNELVDALHGVFLKQSKKEELDVSEDNQYGLAGNNKVEFFITEELLGSSTQLLTNCLTGCATELYTSNIKANWAHQQKIVTPKHREIIESHFKNIQLNIAIIDVWGNVSVAGDFNPPHRHTAMISGVGYIKMPDDIEKERLLEDHDPSSGMINFWDGRPALYGVHMHRAKPVVGDIYCFPAWLPHSVHPFRSKGERWSFSFNIDIANQNPDLEMTEFEKAELRAERRRLLKELKNAE